MAFVFVDVELTIFNHLTIIDRLINLLDQHKFLIIINFSKEMGTYISPKEIIDVINHRNVSISVHTQEKKNFA